MMTEPADSFRVVFRFHGDLNDHLPPQRRNVSFGHAFDHRASVKDVIESLGVPHPEIEVVLVNGVPVPWSYLVRDGDHVEVFPPSAAPALPAEARVGPPPTSEPRFVLDAHLGKLAAYLRLLGFDTLYRNDYHDPDLARISAEEDRILLTRDRNLLKRGIVVHGYFVRETDPRRQVVEILRRFDLWRSLRTYQRCIRCNGILRPVPKETILHLLAPKTRQFYDEFQLCLDCGKVYWKGSHFQPLQEFIDQVLADHHPDLPAAGK